MAGKSVQPNFHRKSTNIIIDKSRIKPIKFGSRNHQAPLLEALEPVPSKSIASLHGPRRIAYYGEGGIFFIKKTVIKEEEK